MTGGKREPSTTAAETKRAAIQGMMPRPTKGPGSKDRGCRFWVQSAWQRSLPVRRPHLVAEIFVKSRFVAMLTVLFAASAILLRAHVTGASRDDKPVPVEEEPLHKVELKNDAVTVMHLTLPAVPNYPTYADIPPRRAIHAPAHSATHT